MRDVEIIPISIPRLNAGDPRRWAGGKLVCSTETSGNGGEWDSHTHPSQHEIIMSGKYNRLHFHLLCLEVMHLFWVGPPHENCVWGWCVFPTYNWRSRRNYTGLNLDWNPTTVKIVLYLVFIWSSFQKLQIRNRGYVLFPPFSKYMFLCLVSLAHLAVSSHMVSSGFCSCRK